VTAREIWEKIKQVSEIFVRNKLKTDGAENKRFLPSYFDSNIYY
jgi:hypothetical protein